MRCGSLVTCVAERDAYIAQVTAAFGPPDRAEAELLIKPMRIQAQFIQKPGSRHPGSRLKGLLDGGFMRETVPGTNLLANITAEHPVPQLRPERVRDGLLVFNRLV